MGVIGDIQTWYRNNEARKRMARNEDLELRRREVAALERIAAAKEKDAETCQSR